MHYQCFTYLPWFIKRYVMFQKHAVLKPLYSFDRVDRVNSESDNEKVVTKTELAEDVNTKHAQ